MKRIIFLAFTLIPLIHLLAQPNSTANNGVCDFIDGTQYSNGNTTGCACTWYSIEGTDTILNCAFGNCGQSFLEECVWDCNGHGGAPTNSIPRECDATAIPVCWFQGGGSAGALFCGAIALSIELVDFWGNATPTYNEIMWAVRTQTDNDYFTISHSINGITYTELGILKGEGSTLEYKVYRFLHLTPKLGINYYKLKQTDFNGVYEEFPIIAINNKPYKGVNLFTDIYPNPNTGIFYFNYLGTRTSMPIQIEIISTIGRVMLQGEVINFNTSQAISLNIPLKKGVYFIRLTQNNKTETKSILIN